MPWATYTYKYTHRSIYQLNHAIIKHITALYDNKKH